MAGRLWYALCGFLLLLLLVGCGGTGTPGSGGVARRTTTTNGNGDAFFSFPGRSESITVRNSSTDDEEPDIQVLGVASDTASLYVAADPARRFHPAMTSGVPDGVNHRDVYLTPADLRTGSNTTSYHEVDGALLRHLTLDYAPAPSSTTVNGLRDLLATRAAGHGAGLVVTVFSPLTSYSDALQALEIAQRTTDLGDAFQAIGWSYLFTSRGFATSQSLQVWEIDPYDMSITRSAGALSDTYLAIVAPTNNADGDILPSSLRVELTWDAPVDLDLHLVRTGYNLYDAFNDCYWQYLEQNWGSLQRGTDDPRLLYDVKDGYGPETILLDAMTPGERYSVVVDYWGDAQEQPVDRTVTATVRVRVGNSGTTRTFQATLRHGEPFEGDYRVLCEIDGSTGAISTTTAQTMERAARRSPGTKRAR